MDEPNPLDPVQTYRELEWMRYYDYKGKQWHSRSQQRKVGWTGYMFKELFGSWPQQWLRSLMPVEPSDEVRKIVRKRDNAFKKEVKSERKRNNNGAGLFSGHTKAGKKDKRLGGDGEMEGGDPVTHLSGRSRAAGDG